ncbi:hypothetical protein BLNAU_12404 [Blattamonas nauphoetae]|uniref:Protein kinase domain-containing protein n=1 Tax=Blattamonas nauphoetae TaxID=2049346 RepID=A0ABQ9XKN7_9EUKA|nr:hypothetical protein BLNAU_12404 [Blattamonas nauphoetae]
MDTNTTNEFRCPECQPNEEVCTTTLVSSSFVNASSLSFGSGIPTNRHRLTQKVIGCSMLRSTDHFSGTALRDMNMGGNVLCSNSTFAHCSSATDQNITQGGRFEYDDKPSASTLTFESCTFRHMTYESTSDFGGAAISLVGTLADLVVTLCAFHNCTVTGEDGDGGAISFWGTGENANHASTGTISHSSFTDCSCLSAGGALALVSLKSTSVDNNFFQGNSALGGGAFAWNLMISVSISNSSFIDNMASLMGGTVMSESLASIKFTDVLFRNNVDTNPPTASDMFFLTTTSEIASNVTRCDSSSAIPTLIYTDDISFFETDSTLLSQVTLGFTIVSCSVSHSETESTVTITTLNAVSGVMSVLLSGGLVPRLVFVTFESPGSTTGTGTTTTTVLPSTNEYSLEAAVLAGFKPESSFMLVVASLVTPNTTKIDLTGTKLVSGSYSMLVEDASGTPTNISLTVSSSTELSTTMALYPVSSAELKYGTEFTVTSVERETTSLAVLDGLSFTTPDEPERIVGIWGELDSNGNTTWITLCGRQIATGSYTVKLDSENGPSFSISFSDGLRDERNSSASSVSIFGDSPILSFDTTYTLFSVTRTTTTTPVLIDANPNSFMISATSRITDVTIGSLSDPLKTRATLTMTGRELEPNREYSMKVTGQPKSSSLMGSNADPDIRTITIRSDSSSPSESGSKSIVFYPHDSAELLFGYEYSVDSVSFDGSVVHKNPDLSFCTPDEPSRLSSIDSCSLTASKDGVIVIVKGFALKQDTTLMIVNSSDGDEIESDVEIDVKTGSECWISFKVGWEENTTHLEFDKTYTLVGGRRGSNDLIVMPDLSFTVPSGPIVKSISAPVDCSSSSFSVVIGGTDLPIESGFRVELVGGLWFLVDFGSSTSGNGTISASLPDQMQFDTVYSVGSVTKDGRKMKCESMSFRTPVGPTLVDVTASLSASSVNNVILKLESVRMPVGEMTLSVQKGSSTRIALAVSFVSSEAGLVEVVVFGGSTLKYGTSYTVVSLRSPSLNCSLDGPITFETPAAPARIKTASCSLVGELKRHVEVVLTGEAFPAGSSFSISLVQIDDVGNVIADTSPITLSDTFDGVIGGTALTTHTLSIALFPVPQSMKYSCRYRITSLTISTVRTAVEDAAIFRVPAEPTRIVGIWGELDSSGNAASVTLRGRQIATGSYTVRLNSESVLAASLETVTLTFGGRCFDVGDFTVNLQVISPSIGTPFEVACSTVSETELNLTLQISTSDPSSVEFGDVLSVLSLKSDSSSAILDNSTFSIPHPPRVDTASFSFYSDLNTTFSVTLRGTDLPSNERFLVVLDSNDSFEMEITNSRSGTSAEMAIGWTDSLQYDTEYRIVSIRNEESGKTVFVDSSLTFTTGQRPKRIGLFIDSSSPDSSRLCGREDEPCSSMDSAWKIASNVGALDISLRLILNATTSFTETSISLSLSQSSLSSLDSSLEWRGRLTFGKNKRSNDSFVIQANSVERHSQSMKENMKWWLPVAIVLGVSVILLVVIVLLCCRRKSNQKKESLASQKELDCVDEMKIEMKEEFGCGTDVHVMGNESTYTGLKAMDEKTETTQHETFEGSTLKGFGVEMIPAIRFNEQNGQMEEVLGNKTNTLFNRLHNPHHKPLRNRRRVSWEIGRGLMKIADENKNAMILGFLSPHLIMFDKNDGIVFQQNAPSHGPPEPSPPAPFAVPIDAPVLTQLSSSGMEKEKDEHVLIKEMDKELVSFDASLQSQTNNAEQSLGVSEETQPNSRLSSFSGIRWMAPELVNQDGTMRTEGVDLTKAAVFSLGLVLFSIETGQVPFGEIDALSTHRQLSSGLLPLMELVSSEEMVEMITKCVSPVAKNRPSLSEIESFLAQQASKNPTPFHNSSSSFDHPSKERYVLHLVSPGIINSQANHCSETHS